MNLNKNIFTLFTTLLLTACGGGDSSTNIVDNSNNNPIVTSPIVLGDNKIDISINDGPLNNYLNGIFGSIEICNLNNQCHTVDNVIFDTGSVGVRILKEALPDNFLSPINNSNGTTYSNCGTFVSGYTWGDLAYANIKLGKLSSTSTLPIHVIGQSTNSVPTTCSSGNGKSLNQLSDLGANGIIGIGLFDYDCGEICAQYRTTAYYACYNGVCSTSVMQLNRQLVNPILKMPEPYNNGNVISLPNISNNGAISVSGSIYLGINTAQNNTFNFQNIINTNENGFINASFNGKTYSNSFIDSGSSIYGISDSTIALCTQLTYESLYCPTNLTNYDVNINNLSFNQNFNTSISIDNAYNLFQTGNNVFKNMAFDFSEWPNSLDFGLPFYFGKNIATGIESKSSSIANGAYYAF